MRYLAGEPYDFVVTAVGEARALLPGLLPALRRIGRERLWAVGLATLEGNFEVVARALPRRRGGGIGGAGGAPWRLRAAADDPPFAVAAAAAAAVFFVAVRLAFLGRGRLPGGSVPRAARAALAPAVRGQHAAAGFAGDPGGLRVEHLYWLDLPLRGRTEGRRGASAAPTWAAIAVGVVFENLPLAWVRLLVAMDAGACRQRRPFRAGGYTRWRRCRPGCGRRGPSPSGWGRRRHRRRPRRRSWRRRSLAWLDDGAACYRRRGSRAFSAEGGLKRACELGLNGSVGGAGTRFVAAPRDRRGDGAAFGPVAGRAACSSRMPGWLAAPAQRAELERLLGQVFAVELADALEVRRPLPGALRLRAWTEARGWRRRDWGLARPSPG